MNYLQRMFSWNGQAGRLEFFGCQLLGIGVIGLFYILPVELLIALDVKSKYITGCLAILVVLLVLVLNFLSSVRRLRHLNWPVWLAFLFFIPGLNILSPVFVLCLLLIPGADLQEPDTPSYFCFNLWMTIISMLIPLILLFGGIFLAKYYPQTLRYMPAVRNAMEEQKLQQNSASRSAASAHYVYR